jgi:hypothetical protein
MMTFILVPAVQINGGRIPNKQMRVKFILLDNKPIALLPDRTRSLYDNAIRSYDGKWGFVDKRSLNHDAIFDNSLYQELSKMYDDLAVIGIAPRYSQITT